MGINGNGHTTLRLDPGSGGSQILGLSVTNSSGNGITLAVGQQHRQLQLRGTDHRRQGIGQPWRRHLPRPYRQEEQDRVEPHQYSERCRKRRFRQPWRGYSTHRCPLNKIQSNRVGTNAVAPRRLPTSTAVWNSSAPARTRSAATSRAPARAAPTTRPAPKEVFPRSTSRHRWAMSSPETRTTACLSAQVQRRTSCRATSSEPTQQGWRPLRTRATAYGSSTPMGPCSVAAPSPTTHSSTTT